MIPNRPFPEWKIKLRFFFRSRRIPLLETLNPSCAVNELLLPGVKRVAVIANFNVRAFNGGPGFNDVAARTGEARRLVFRMNFLSHNYSFNKNYEFKINLFHSDSKPGKAGLCVIRRFYRR
jgi:hypothetical protein